ncbi:MAG: DUF1559 domain-containing protein, partial [Phycisphaerales bacterium]|nr:DUF1559 domain-containing protein [Phycisphaerales bacterium]
ASPAASAGAARAVARQSQCANAQKQLGLAMHTYAADHKQAVVSSQMWQVENPAGNGYIWHEVLSSYIYNQFMNGFEMWDGPAKQSAGRSPFWGCPEWDRTTMNTPTNPALFNGFGISVWLEPRAAFGKPPNEIGVNIYGKGWAPGSAGYNPGTPGYLFSMDQVANFIQPSKRIILGPSKHFYLQPNAISNPNPNLHQPFRHAGPEGGVGNYLYLDGHVTSLTREKSAFQIRTPNG